MENNEFCFKKNVNQNEIRDVCDGKIYQNILNSEHGELFKDNKAFSFCLNTDGISLCNKSKLTLWPVYLSINEVDIGKRFTIENTILAGN